MGNLLPFKFADLGFIEFAWLFLLFGGLSIVAPARNRPVAAVWTWLGFVLIGFISPSAGDTVWLRWIGPLLVVPVFAAGVVLLGLVRSRIPPKEFGLYAAGMVVLTAAARPFGGFPLAGGVLLGIGWFVCAMALDGSGALRAWTRIRVVGWLRVGPLAALALLAFVTLVGYGFVSGVFMLFGCWLLFAVLAQGREMRKYVRRRLIGAPLVLLILLTLSFFIMRTAPGGPFDKDKALEPAIKEAIEAKYGLDKPLPAQFKKYMAELVWDGNLGPSFKHKGRKVVEVIGHHAPHSARLGLAAVCLAVLVGVTAGLVSGIKQNSIFDYASMATATLGLALPTFIVGPMLVLVFAMKLDWFNVTGWEDFPKDLVLPAITLALPFMARIARLTRAGMLEVVNQDYIRTARAKGLSEPKIVLRHTLKGTLLPVVSFLGPGIAQLLTGSLVVERIFGVPGLGNEFVEAALSRDYGVAMGLVLVYGTLLIVFNLIVDIVYAFLDPRIRHG